jgi:hypothetical protein
MMKKNLKCNFPPINPILVSFGFSEESNSQSTVSQQPPRPTIDSFDEDSSPLGRQGPSSSYPAATKA